MHIITWENVEEFNQAWRDVLMMFADIAEEGGRLSDANFWIRFDPLKFVDVIDDGQGTYGNLELVRTGAALSILCDFYDRFEEERPLLDDVTSPFVTAIHEGKLSSYADIGNIVIEALAREKANTLSPWFNKSVYPVYQKYVQSYFTRLSGARL
jgi:hypothetical protein